MNPLKIDPTRTGIQRKLLERDIVRRLRKLQEQIKQVVYEQDSFGLRDRLSVNEERFSSTQLDVSRPEIVSRLKSIQDALDPADVLKLEDNFHITVRYGLHDETPERVKWIVSQHGPLTAALRRLSLFQGEKQDVLKIDVVSPDLHSLNAHLGILPNTQTFDYHPHLTVAYLRPGTGQKYLDLLTGLEGARLRFGVVTFSSPDRIKTEVINNAFCPTGKGGRIDNTCPPKTEGQKWTKRQLVSGSGDGEIVDKTGKRWRIKHTVKSNAEGEHRHVYEVLHPENLKVSGAGGAETGWDKNRIMSVMIYPEYQRRGIASALYDHIESHIGKLEQNPYTTEGGTAFWKSRKSPTTNAPWQFISTDQQVAAFTQWLRQQMNLLILGQLQQQGQLDPDHWLTRHVEDTFKKGMTRAYDYLERHKQELAKPQPYYQGSRDQFLRSAFTRPASINRIKLLAGRAFNELQGMTDTMATQMQRTLTDGFIQGKSPWDIARDLSRDVDDLGIKRAQRIARTECLVGETSVDSAVVRASFRRWYEGDVVEVTTRGGRKFTATPNHPMLTQDGWVSAGELKQSYYLICDSRYKDSSSGDPNVDQRPTSIADLFGTLKAVGILKRVPSLDVDFHGDGMDGQVDVASSDRGLSVGGFSTITQQLEEYIFSPSGQAASGFCSFCGQLLPVNQRVHVCPLTQFDSRLFEPSLDYSAIYSKMSSYLDQGFSRCIEISDQPYINSVDQLVRNSTVSPGVIRRVRQIAGYTGFPQDRPDEFLVRTDYFSNLTLAQPGQIEFDNVVSLVVRPFRGHVYNLQTDAGFFTISGGVYTGNTIRAHNEGQLDGMEHMGLEEVGVAVEWSTSGMGITKRGNPSPCKLCAPLKGMILTIEEARGKLPRHPNCLVSPKVPIYTADGWKPIGQVKVGDLVLTHRGRFRRVLELHRNLGGIETEVVRFSIRKNGDLQELTLTGNHPVLVNGVWRDAIDLEPGDKIRWMSSVCNGCGADLPVGLKYCGQKCQWKNEEFRKQTSNAVSASAKVRYASGIWDGKKMTAAAHKQVRKLIAEGRFNHLRPSGDANPAKRPEVRKKISDGKKGDKNPMRVHKEIGKKNGQDLAAWLKKNPDRHANRILASKGYKTSIEKKMDEALKILGIECEYQHHVDGLWIDFAQLEFKIAIECDGMYWHQDRDKDARRDARLVAEGWTVIHFTDAELNDDALACAAKIKRLMDNHGGEYTFADFDVLWVTVTHLKKPRLYNLSVEEDESYVAKGCVVHNCMCSWIPAGVGESSKGQLKTRARIQSAIDASIKAEMPRRKKRSLSQQRQRSRWAGATLKVKQKRPKSIL